LKKIIIRCVSSPLVLASAITFYSHQGLADSWQQAGTVSVLAGYNSNPGLSLNQTGAWFGILDPTYKLTRIIGLNELSTGLGLNIIRSSDTAANPNRQDPSGFLDWKHQGDTNIFDISTNYNESSTRYSQVSNLGPAFVDSSRISRKVAGNWGATLSARSTLLTTASYGTVSFNNQTYTNYTTRTADMTYKYAWNELISPLAKISYVDYRPINGNQLSHITIVWLGWDWIASDELVGDVEVGNSEATHVPAGSVPNKGQFNGNLHYKGEHTAFDFNANRETTLTDLSGFITVDQASGRWSYAFSNLYKSGIDLGWSNNHYASAVINRTGAVWLQHDYSSSWHAQAYYMRRISEQAGLGKAFSNEVGVSLVYTGASETGANQANQASAGRTGSGQTVPGPTVPGQTIPEQLGPDQIVPGQTVPGQIVPQTVPGQTVPDQTVPGQTVPGQTVPDQTIPDQTVPGQ
jgi:hypothetical protein